MMSFSSGDPFERVFKPGPPGLPNIQVMWLRISSFTTDGGDDIIRTKNMCIHILPDSAAWFILNENDLPGSHSIPSLLPACY